MRTLIFALLAMAAGAGVADETPQALPVIDPLLQPVPKLERQLVYTPDLRPASEKIVPFLRQKISEMETDENIKIIVTLVDPEFFSKAKPGSAEHDKVRASYIAALEHNFVAEAAGLGFRPFSGLTHSPIVCGEVLKSNVNAVADLAMVRAVEFDLELWINRVEGGNLIRSPELRARGGRGKDVGVAVLDTGIAWDHPELRGRVAVRADFTDTEPHGSDDYGYDDEGHGTSCAGIIAGTTRGMAPQAHLWSVKVIRSNGSTSSSIWIRALDSVYDWRSSYGGVRAVNMSLGSSDVFNSACDANSPSATLAMKRLNSVGVAVVVSSGNDGCKNGVSFPACVSHAISVGAVYDANLGSVHWSPRTCHPQGCSQSSTAADQIACYSNSGNPLDVLAPAHNAETPTIGGGYTSSFGGTSAAAPYVVGIAAQIISLRPLTTPAQLRVALTSTGKKISDPGNGLTRRRVDAQAAYMYLTGGENSSGQNVAFCGNAYYDDGTTEGTTWFGGGQAGDPDKMFAVRFNLSNFGYSPGDTQITKFCVSNQGAFQGGPWPNQVLVYSNRNGLPDTSRLLAQGTVFTGDGRGWYEVTLASPVTLGSDFWLVMRGDPRWAGEDFNVDFDETQASGHSLWSDSGVGSLRQDSVDYMLRATLKRGSGGSCTDDLTNGVVCLRNKRFEFTGTWTDFANPANTKPLIWTPVEDINATGGFQNNPSGIQVVMRVADACSQTGTYWVWLGGFTDAGWTIRVKDTVTGRGRSFNRTRQSGAFPITLRDATTFPCN